MFLINIKLNRVLKKESKMPILICQKQFSDNFQTSEIYNKSIKGNR